MSRGSVVVFGAGGHGKVVCDVVDSASPGSVVGFVDDGVAAGTAVLGRPVLGGRAWLEAHRDVAVALGVGDNTRRREVAAWCAERGLALHTAVHARAVVAPSAYLGAGAVVMAGAIVNPDAVVGEGAIVNTAAVVEHDCRIGDFAHVSPNGALGGGVEIGALTHVGLGASVLPLVRIGARTVVGAGAVVVRDLGDGVVARGVPARVVRGGEAP